MKRILASTALVALAATPVIAESHSTVTGEMESSTSVETTNGDASMQVQGDTGIEVDGSNTETDGTEAGEMDGSASTEMTNGETSMQAQGDASFEAEGMTIHASDLIGKRVYIRTEAAADADITKTVSKVPEEWENAGDVDDVLLTQDGDIEKIVLSTGGFLGIGAKEVTASIEELKFVANTDQEGGAAFFVVFTGARTALEARDDMDPQAVLDEGFSFFSELNLGMGESDTGGDGEMNAGADVSSDMSGGGNAAADAGRPTGIDLDMDMVNLTDEERDQLTADQIEGQTVFDANGKRVGEVSELVLSGDGKITDIVVEVGGFLGIGEKPVAVAYEDVTLKRNSTQADGRLYVSTTYTEEDFDSMEEWGG